MAFLLLYDWIPPGTGVTVNLVNASSRLQIPFNLAAYAGERRD